MRPHQGRTSQGVQSAHHRPLAQRRVCALYTSIPTNLLFFDRSGPTKEIWYYEHPLPEGRKTYTKTQPMRFEDFEACLAWWNKREENDSAWKVKASDVLKYDAEGNLVSVNLDIKNPQRHGRLRAPSARKTRRRYPRKRGKDPKHHPGNQERIDGVGVNGDWKLTRLGDVLRSVSRPVRLSPERTYRLVGAHWYAKGLYVKEQKSGGEIQAKTLFEVKKGDFVYNRLFAWKGSFAVASKELMAALSQTSFRALPPSTALIQSFSGSIFLALARGAKPLVSAAAARRLVGIG